MRDLYNNIKGTIALGNAVHTATVTGESIDTQNAKSLAFLLVTGEIEGDGAFGASIQESADGTNWAAAPASEIQTDAPSALGEDEVYRLGYLGGKRYARIALTKASGTSIVAGAAAILSPLNKPVV